MLATIRNLITEYNRLSKLYDSDNTIVISFAIDTSDGTIELYYTQDVTTAKERAAGASRVVQGSLAVGTPESLVITLRDLVDELRQEVTRVTRR